ncbi:hypothetical protein SDC9_208343 [bioreactor metagenome]|uniref:Uncharacterized protein n=1 Tax=bioreactor metagenome TaxID=1076179 RepID=A0A645JJV9_9ZZZZ
MTVEELAAYPDDFLLINSAGFKKGKIGEYINHLIDHRRHLVGWGIILFSIWLTLNVIFHSFFPIYTIDSPILDEIYRVFRSVLDLLPSLLLPFCCVLIGIRLIKGGNHSNKPADSYSMPKPDSTRPSSKDE